MIELTEFGSAYDPKTKYAVKQTKTIRQALQEAGYTVGSAAIVSVNGKTLPQKDLDSTFAELEIKSGARVTVMEKYSSSR